MSDFEHRINKATSPLPGSIPQTINYKLSVKLKNEGLTILELYTQSFPQVSKNIWEQKIKTGMLTVNGKVCEADLILKAGWMTENTVDNKTEPDVSNSIKLIYEDDNLLVIDKPSPLPMHPSGRFNRNTLTELLKLTFPEEDFKIVHRLDANTTGVILLAKDSKTANSISQQFQCNSIKKEYLALVEGIIIEDSQVIIEKIGTTKTTSGGRALSEMGKDSETKIMVIKRNIKSNQTLLKVEPKNGRTNQIRLHLTSIGHPIIGDHGYKDSNYFKNNPLTYSTDSLYLHAHKIIINYKNADKQFIAKIPEKFSNKISI